MKPSYKDNENLKKKKNFKFLTNNVNGLQSTKKRLCPKGILFLQETHSSVEIEKKWIDDSNDKIYYSHGKTNSCGVLSIHSNLR